MKEKMTHCVSDRLSLSSEFGMVAWLSPIYRFKAHQTLHKWSNATQLLSIAIWSQTQVFLVSMSLTLEFYVASSMKHMSEC